MSLPVKRILCLKRWPICHYQVHAMKFQNNKEIYIVSQCSLGSR